MKKKHEKEDLCQAEESHLNITYTTTVRIYKFQVSILQAKWAVDTIIQSIQSSCWNDYIYFFLWLLKPDLHPLLSPNSAVFFVQGQETKVVFMETRRTFN